MTERVYIFDTTLRDGEQSPGCSMTTPEKLKMASKLVDLGVDLLEAGFPIASEGDFEAVRAVGNEYKDVRVAALARAIPAASASGGRLGDQGRRAKSGYQLPARLLHSAESDPPRLFRAQGCHCDPERSSVRGGSDQAQSHVRGGGRSGIEPVQLRIPVHDSCGSGDHRRGDVCGGRQAAEGTHRTSGVAGAVERVPHGVLPEAGDRLCAGG